MWKEIIEVFGAVIVSLGGFEFVKWVSNRKANSRKAHAEAATAAIDAADKGVTSYERTNAILSKQVEELTRKFADSTAANVDLKGEVADLKAKVTELQSQVAALLETDRRFRCEVVGCANRVPPNGY